MTSGIACCGRRGGGDGDCEQLTGGGLLRCLAPRLPVMRYRTAAIQRLEPLAGQRRDRIGERAVKPPAAGVSAMRASIVETPVHAVAMWR